jgi:hypothetical protein
MAANAVRVASLTSSGVATVDFAMKAIREMIADIASDKKGAIFEILDDAEEALNAQLVCLAEQVIAAEQRSDTAVAGLVECNKAQSAALQSVGAGLSALASTTSGVGRMITGGAPPARMITGGAPPARMIAGGAPPARMIAGGSAEAPRCTHRSHTTVCCESQKHTIKCTIPSCNTLVAHMQCVNEKFICCAACLAHVKTATRDLLPRTPEYIIAQKQGRDDAEAAAAKAATTTTTTTPTTPSRRPTGV